MIILVSMRTVEDLAYPETRDAISHDWSRLFASYGLTPILVPNALRDLGAFFKLGASGLLLTGGDDLGPDDEPSLRDRTETLLLQGAIGHGLPIFGACRGLHVINRYFGGELARKLLENHVGEHSVKLDGGGTIRINSFHNQGVVVGGLAEELVPFASTESGVIEAVTHRTLPVTAVQWHPERPNPAADLDRKLLQQWFAQCG
jgi:gamma-glutamyl-gamma-aminobutyrate hydrolase PuuD